jgi:hypothetical protein
MAGWLPAEKVEGGADGEEERHHVIWASTAR